MSSSLYLIEFLLIRNIGCISTEKSTMNAKHVYILKKHKIDLLKCKLSSDTFKLSSNSEANTYVRKIALYT